MRQTHAGGLIDPKAESVVSVIVFGISPFVVLGEFRSVLLATLFDERSREVDGLPDRPSDEGDLWAGQPPNRQKDDLGETTL